MPELLSDVITIHVPQASDMRQIR